MDQTRTHNEQASDTLERAKQTTWSEATKTVSKFTSEPLFINRLNSMGLTVADWALPEYSLALSDYAKDYCDAYGQDGIVDKKLADQIMLVASSPYFLHVQKVFSWLDKKREHGRLPDNEWETYKNLKPHMAWYNQMLSDFAYNNPDEKLSDLNRALIEQSILSFPKDVDSVESSIKQITRGARTEAASRKLLDLMDIEYAPGSVEDDVRGGDIILPVGDSRVKIDVKSSLDPIAKIRGGYEQIEKNNTMYAILKNKHDEHKSDHVIAIFPGFTDDDFGDSLSLKLSPDNIAAHAQNFAIQLQRAIHELNL